MSTTFAPPEDAVGAELVWWREGGGWHSLVTIAGAQFVAQLGVEKVGLVFEQRDVGGSPLDTWETELGAEDVIFWDSRESARPTTTAREGALVIWVTAKNAKYARQYRRAMVSVDWLGDGGEIVSLHADQSVVRDSRALAFTEMVFLETAETRTYLVIVNGAEEQPASSLALVLRNARGEERVVSYDHVMVPFAVSKVSLAALTPGLSAFCGGTEATVRGAFAARGVFIRPYVMTEGALASGYHGGDRYAMKSIPRLVHRAFPFAEAQSGVPWELMFVTGQKEMNPAYAVHRRDLTTRVHLFQSHGALEEDFFVDATLYDTSGRVVVHRERWAKAPRHGTTTCALAELAPLGFEGHVALRFSEDPEKEAFPHRLQALVEYRTAHSVARTMLWSDRWNTPDRVLRQSHPWRAMYRVFSRGPRLSTLAVTNPSVAPDYDRVAAYAIRVRNARGEELLHRGELAPNATHVTTIAALFPERWDDEVVLAIVESPFDLASMHLTTDARSGAVAAEHLLAVVERDGEHVFSPCGG